MRRKKIPPKLNDVVWKLYAEGKTSDQISEIMLSDYDFSVGKTAINNLLISLKEERKQVAQAIYAKACQEGAYADVNILSDVMAKLYQDYNELRDMKDYKSARTYAETLAKYISKRIDLSGLNERTSEKTEEQVREELLQRLNNLD